MGRAGRIDLSHSNGRQSVAVAGILFDRPVANVDAEPLPQDASASLARLDPRTFRLRRRVSWPADRSSQRSCLTWSPGRTILEIIAASRRRLR